MIPNIETYRNLWSITIQQTQQHFSSRSRAREKTENTNNPTRRGGMPASDLYRFLACRACRSCAAPQREATAATENVRTYQEVDVCITKHV